MRVKHELNREVVVEALALAIATIDALEDHLGGPMDWGKADRDEMKRMIELLVTDDADLERLAKSASWRVGHLVGHWKRF